MNSKIIDKLKFALVIVGLVFTGIGVITWEGPRLEEAGHGNHGAQSSHAEAADGHGNDSHSVAKHAH